MLFFFLGKQVSGPAYVLLDSTALLKPEQNASYELAPKELITHLRDFEPETVGEQTAKAQALATWPTLGVIWLVLLLCIHEFSGRS